MAKIDYSKRKKGQSKREYYAQQTGGKLDYKSGKVTVKKQTKPASYSIPKGYEDSGASSNEETAQLRSGLYADDTKYGPAYNAPEFSYETYDTKNLASNREKASKVKSSDGSQKSSLVGGLFGTPSASAQVKGASTSRTPSTITQGGGKSWFERGLEIMKDPFGLEPKVRGLVSDKPWAKGFEGLLSYEANPIYQREQGAGDAISQLLSGKTPELGISELNPNDTTGIFSQSNQPYNPQPTPGPAPRNTPFLNEDTYNAYKSSSSNRTPSPVSNPFVAPQSSSQISSVYQNLSPQSQPDYGIYRNENAGTVDRMGGQGAFSTGEFGNGGGGYGFSGVVGTPQDNEQSLLNILLGINTANASEMPQQPMGNLSDYYNPAAKQVLGLNRSQATGGFVPGAFGGGQEDYRKDETRRDDYEPQYDPRQQQQVQQGGVQGGGQPQGVDYNKQIKQQEKAFKAQEKAQKKALEQLIKSITGQYDESRTEGTESLEKSKQENLLRLSGLFGFANQDPNSEQRAQYEGRAQQDAASQLSDFLANLSRGQAQDISGAKQNYQGNVANIASQRAQALQQLQQAQQEQAYKMQQLQAQSRGGSQKLPSFAMAAQQQGARPGGNWDAIAQTLSQQYPLYPGSENSAILDAMMTGQAPQQNQNQRQAASYAPDGSYTFGEVDPASGKQIFYDNNGAFVN